MRGRSRGQSLVEAAITLPIVLLLTLGVTDLGRSFYYREAVANSARQALRMAVSSYQHATADGVCAGTSGGPVAVSMTSAVPPAAGAIATIANQAALESSKDGTPAGSAIAGGSITIVFHCLNGAAITNATGDGGPPSDPGSDSITATVTKPMTVITPVLWPMFSAGFPISVTTSERVEY